MDKNFDFEKWGESIREAGRETLASALSKYTIARVDPFPEIPRYEIPKLENPLIPKIEELCALNEQLNRTNHEIREMFNESKQRVESVESEIKSIKHEHRHDNIKGLVQNIVVAMISVVLTVIATKLGWL